MASVELQPQVLSPQSDCSPLATAALSPAASAPSPGRVSSLPGTGVAQSPVSMPPDVPGGEDGGVPEEGSSGRRPPGKRWRGHRGRRHRKHGRGALSRDVLIAEGHPLAPFNTTDFIMEDHSDQPAPIPEAGAPINADSDQDMLFDRYGQPTPRESPHTTAGGADASVTLPNWTTPSLEPSISRLVAEHIQMEGHVEELEARIAQLRHQRRAPSEEGSDDEGARRGEVYMSPETAAKIRVLQEEIHKLEEENAALRESNERLLGRGRRATSPSDRDERSYTSDSESDSSSSSSSGSSRSHSSSSSGSESSDSQSCGSRSPSGSPRSPGDRQPSRSRSRSPLSPRPPASV